MTFFLNGKILRTKQEGIYNLRLIITILIVSMRFINIY